MREGRGVTKESKGCEYKESKKVGEIYLTTK
jgi:hypothetical protein